MSFIYNKDPYFNPPGHRPEYRTTQSPGLYPASSGSGDNLRRYDFDSPQPDPGYRSFVEPQHSTPNLKGQFSTSHYADEYISPIPVDYIANPLANVAVQYGTKLMGTGKQMVDKEINRYIQVPMLKLYFSVNTNYVYNKLRTVLFPFTNKDWSLKYNQGSRIGPRYDMNSPDLYIPFMAYLTYVLIAGVILGINGNFQPELLGIIASEALAWTIIEIILQLIIIYFISVSSSLTTFDILAYSGYKFIGVNIIILVGVSIISIAHWPVLLYCCISIGYFTVQTLKWRLMAEDEDQHFTTQNFGSLKYKRKTYFLVFLAASHVFQMWWLSTAILKKF